MTERRVVEALARPLEAFGAVRIRPMFGEWMVYVDDAPAAIVGASRLYLKLPGLSESDAVALCGNADQPYPGAKGYAVVEAEQFADAAWLARVRAIRSAAPAAPPKRPKATRASG